MRIAKCINSLHLSLSGSKGSVAIGKGWEGDLDQVLGEQIIAAVPATTDPDDETKVVEPAKPERRIDVTIADMLGQYLTDANFTVAPPPHKKGPAPAASSAAAPPKE